MTLNDLKTEFYRIRNMGFVRSTRKGPTGIGHTFENLMGIDENNLSLPDIGRIEIKTSRTLSSSPITLFTFNKSVWTIKNKDLIKQYGYFDVINQRQALYLSLQYGYVNHNLFIDVDSINQKLHLKNINSEILGSWDMYVVIGTFYTKLSKIFLVFADTMNTDNHEYFHFNRALLLQNPDQRLFLNSIIDSKAIIDLRMYIKDNGTARNHGTAFRCKVNDLTSFYSNIIEL